MHTTAIALIGLALVASAAAQTTCRYGGVEYSDGATLCQSATEHRCRNGSWIATELRCTAQEGENPQACTYRGLRYSSGAISCQRGTRFACENGRWESRGGRCVARPPAADAPAGVRP